MQRILVIDDDPAITSVLKRGLSYEGFAVETVSNGADGLALARERPPDLVILDLMMPGLSGLEVLQRLRAADARLPTRCRGWSRALMIMSSSRSPLRFCWPGCMRFCAESSLSIRQCCALLT